MPDRIKSSSFLIPRSLKGVITDDGMPQGSTVTSTWSVVSGPGPVVFGNRECAGDDRFVHDSRSLHVETDRKDTEFTVSDEMQVTVLLNQPPTADAGPDQEITLPGNAQLNGTATDDGLPRGSTLETFWSFVSGPAPVIFPGCNVSSTRSRSSRRRARMSCI